MAATAPAAAPSPRHAHRRGRGGGGRASTVSRAFTRPERVNHATREHVLAVAEELGYAPNPAARALESGRTNTLALLVPDITNPYFSGVIKGAERAAAAAGLTLLSATPRRTPASRSSSSAGSAPPSTGSCSAPPGCPTTSCSRRRAEPDRADQPGDPGVACVVADFDSGTRQIVDHLASFGHRSLVFLGGPPESWSGARRWAGLQAAADERGSTATPARSHAPTLAGGPAAADAVLPRAPRRWSPTTTCWRSA